MTVHCVIQQICKLVLGLLTGNSTAGLGKEMPIYRLYKEYPVVMAGLLSDPLSVTPLHSQAGQQQGIAKLSKAFGQ